MIENWSFFIRFLTTTICCLAFLYYSFLQAKEISEESDDLDTLRWTIIAILLLITITLIPTAFYQLFVALGHEYKTLRNVVSLIGAVNLIGITIGWGIVFTYRRKE